MGTPKYGGLKAKSSSLGRKESLPTLSRPAKKAGSFLNVSNTAILNRLIDLKHITNVPYQSTAENPHFYRSARQLSYAGTLIKKFLTKFVSSK